MRKTTNLINSCSTFSLFIFLLIGMTCPFLTYAETVGTGFSAIDDHITTFGFQRHIWQVNDGTLGAIVQLNPEGLVLIRSIDNGMSWGKVLQINQRNDVTASGEIDELGNLRIVVGAAPNAPSNSTDIGFYLLNYEPALRTWVLVKKKVIYDGSNVSWGFSPEITRDSIGRIWVCFSLSQNINNGLKVTVPVVYSINDGESWIHAASFGTPNNWGEKFGILFHVASRVGMVFFDHDGNSITMNWAYRDDAYPLGSVWNTKMMERIFLRDGAYAYHSNVAKDDLGQVHLVYPNSGARWYRKYNGSWGQPQYLWDTESHQSVGVSGRDVFAIASIPFDPVGKQRQIQFKKYNYATVSWEGPFLLTPSMYRPFDQVLLYDAQNDLFKDVTMQAADSVIGDVYSDMTQYMVVHQQDYIQFGMTEPFNHVGWNVSGMGQGGRVVWEYWNGVFWAPLTVNIQLMGNDGGIDFIPPSDWTMMAINGGIDLYYVRAEVVDPFTIGAVGSMITGMGRSARPVLPANFTGLLPVLYVQGEAPPYSLLFYTVPLK